MQLESSQKIYTLVNYIKFYKFWCHTYEAKKMFSLVRNCCDIFSIAKFS